MALTKSLTKHGNSMALVIEKSVLELIGAQADTQFEIITDGHSLILTPMSQKNRSQRFRASLEKNRKKYKNAFQKLAE